MNKLLLSAALATIATGSVMAQSAMDGYQLSQSDLKGTARFMAMGGAFGALGGDLTTLSQNPGGIGVYRNNDLGFTLDLDCQRSTANSMGMAVGRDQTRFLLNNIGGVATWRLNSSVMPNLNFGFTYQKAASFNRAYSGNVPQLANSMSNFIAGISNSNELTVADVETTQTYDPYNPNDGGFVSPWISILGYDSYLVSPTGDNDSPVWVGQWGNSTSGSGWFDVWEHGGVDEYNISFGGNYNNVLFWGMDFGITNINYTAETYWGENLQKAMVDQGNGEILPTTSEWDIFNYYNVNGNGFNYKLGFILKPIQELRLGFAFHTPTWYNLTETFYSDVVYKYGEGPRPGTAKTNNGYNGYNYYNFRTPWRLIASAAGVIGGKFILSADYEWEPYNGMNFSSTGSYNYDGWDYVQSPSFDAYYNTNKDISDYYKSTNTFRIGCEYRVTPQLSLRAGYSFVSSPVKDAAKSNSMTIYTSGTRPQYAFDNTTNYVTCGLGYRYSKFYCDLAYVYKHRESEYHAYTPDIANPAIASPQAKIATSQSQIVLSMGFKF